MVVVCHGNPSLQVALLIVVSIPYFYIKVQKTYPFSNYFQSIYGLMCLRLVNTQPLHQPAVLLGRECSGFRFRSWPLEGTGLQPFVKQHKSVTLPVQRLDSAPASATEKKQGVGKGIQFKLLLSNGSQAVNSSA